MSSNNNVFILSDKARSKADELYNQLILKHGSYLNSMIQASKNNDSQDKLIELSNLVATFRIEKYKDEINNSFTAFKTYKEIIQRAKHLDISDDDLRDFIYGFYAKEFKDTELVLSCHKYRAICYEILKINIAW